MKQDIARRCSIPTHRNQNPSGYSVEELGKHARVGNMGHWNLLILFHFDEDLSSTDRKPCMILLDSLHMADPRRIEPSIRKFVLDVYKAEGYRWTKAMISQIPVLAPKMNQGWFTRESFEQFCRNLDKQLLIQDDEANNDSLLFEKSWETDGIVVLNH
ncbi:hypothetical protein AKJ16_DCAP24079 [Drosera capensis]